MGTIWIQFYWWSSEVLIFTGFLYGGASRDRTDDLIVANDALSQLSYSPTEWRVTFFNFSSRALVSTTRGSLISASRYEPSSGAALLRSETVGLAAAAQAPIPCMENFRASEFAWPLRGSYRLGMRRKHSGNWRMPSLLPGRKYFGEAQTEKKSAQWPRASAEYPRRNQRSRGARTPHRSSRNRRDCAYGCRFHSRSAAEIRPAPRYWAETRGRRTTGRGQIRGHSRCVRSR